jgi:mercuric ion binding protein
MLNKIALTLASALLSGALAFGLSVAPAHACPGKDKAQTAKAEPKQEAVPASATTAVFKVDGMHCGGCGDNIKTALAKATGIYKVDVKSADKRVTVSFDATKISADKIAKLISEAGYPASAEA